MNAEARREVFGIFLVSEYGALGQGLELALSTVPNLRLVGAVQSVSSIASEMRIDLFLIHGDDCASVLKEAVEAKSRFPHVDRMAILKDATPEEERQLGETAFHVITDEINLLELVQLIMRVAHACETTAVPTVLARRRLRPHPELSPREIDVAATIALGRSNREIAAELELQPSTVKNHLHNILEKLSLSSRAELAQYARRSNWVLPSA